MVKESEQPMQDEARLVQQARDDLQAFGILYDRYVERIYAYALREARDVATAEDIVSATFEKALNNLPSYQWRGTSFGAWLYKIARNELRMHWRKQKWTVPLRGIFRSSASVERTVQASNDSDQLQVALGRLSRHDQEILRLRYFESLTNPEIGEVLNCSPNAVAVRLHRALNRLRTQMARLAPEVIFDVEL